MSIDWSALRALFRAHPARSSVLSGVPLLVAGAQGANVLVHGLASPLVVVFVLAMVAFAVGATRHSLASFRTETLEASFLEEPPAQE